MFGSHTIERGDFSFEIHTHNQAILRPAYVLHQTYPYRHSLPKDLNHELERKHYSGEQHIEPRIIGPSPETSNSHQRTHIGKIVLRNLPDNSIKWWTNTDTLKLNRSSIYKNVHRDYIENSDTLWGSISHTLLDLCELLSFHHGSLIMPFSKSIT